LSFASLGAFGAFGDEIFRRNFHDASVYLSAQKGQKLAIVRRFGLIFRTRWRFCDTVFVAYLLCRAQKG
jgi:hypothetical protein